MNKTKLLWSVSLLVIGVATVMIAGSNIFQITLEDGLVRTLGIVDLIAMAVLGFTTVKMYKK